MEVTGCSGSVLAPWLQVPLTSLMAEGLDKMMDTPNTSNTKPRTKEESGKCLLNLNLRAQIKLFREKVLTGKFFLEDSHGYVKDALGSLSV